MASSKKVSLRYRGRRTKIVNLAHKDVCRGGVCLCGSDEFRAHALDPKTGNVAVRIVNRQVPASLHLVPGEWSAALPESVLNAPELRVLSDGRKLDVQVIEAPAPEPAPASVEE